jgi:integrase/recombinase XerD
MTSDLIPISQNAPSDLQQPEPGAMVSRRAEIPTIITQAGEIAALSFVNFFTAEIDNENTRRAYLQAWREFGKWAESQGYRLGDMKPYQLAAYREELKRRYHVRSVKQHLSALRRVFDQLVNDQAISTNPAGTLRGPKFSATQGTTPILSDEETRTLFDSLDTSHLVGIRDRAILSVLVYSVARVSAVTTLAVSDYYQQGRRWKLRLDEKGGKLHEVWCHHNLEEYLSAYIEAAGISKERSTPLFRSVAGRTKQLTENGIDRRDVYRMIRRRALEAGIEKVIGCHTFRATGITLYMENGGSIGEAQKLANHADPRTTKLYDRSGGTVSLDEIERIRF